MNPPPDSERIVRLESWKEAHEDRCKERYSDIRTDTQEIKASLLSLASGIKESVDRIHSRIEEETGKTNAAVETVRGGVVAQKVWILTSVLGGASVVILYLIEKVWE